MTRYIPKDKLKEIRSLSAIDYLKNYHPDLLIRNGRTDYIHVDHDSLHFSNGKWYWWSKRKGGTSAIDYLVTVDVFVNLKLCHFQWKFQLKIVPVFYYAPSVMVTQKEVERR